MEMIVSLHGGSILSLSKMHRRGLQSYVDFQSGVKLDSISLPNIYKESSKCHSGLCNSGSDLNINEHCSGESASPVGEYISNLKYLSFHNGGWYIVWLPGCWLVYSISHVCTGCKVGFIT